MFVFTWIYKTYKGNTLAIDDCNEANHLYQKLNSSPDIHNLHVQLVTKEVNVQIIFVNNKAIAVED